MISVNSLLRIKKASWVETALTVFSITIRTFALLSNLVRAANL